MEIKLFKWTQRTQGAKQQEEEKKNQDLNTQQEDLWHHWCNSSPENDASAWLVHINCKSFLFSNNKMFGCIRGQHGLNTAGPIRTGRNQVSFPKPLSGGSWLFSCRSIGIQHMIRVLGCIHTRPVQSNSAHLSRVLVGLGRCELHLVEENSDAVWMHVWTSSRPETAPKAWGRLYHMAFWVNATQILC